MSMTRTARMAGVVLAGFSLAACGDDAATTEDLPTVMATTSIWADVVDNVACDGQARVETLIPTGGDPHGFEPSLQDRARLDSAALVVVNGLDLEEGLLDTLDAVADAGTPVFSVADHVDPLTSDGDDASETDDDHGDESHREGDDHDHGDLDPHLWFDPVTVASALPELAGALVDAGLEPTAVDACVEDYAAEVSAVDAEIRELVGSIPPSRRKLVTNHDSLGAFAARYGFEVIGTVIPASTSLAEANPAQLEELAALIEQEQVPAIFAETQQSTDDADALAARLGGVDVVSLFTGTLGGPDTGADTYLGFLRTNAGRIADGLA